MDGRFLKSSLGRLLSHLKYPRYVEMCGADLRSKLLVCLTCFCEGEGMKSAPWMCLPTAVAFLLPILGIAQTPAPADQAQERRTVAQTSDRPTTEWRITEKEVKAVQAELTRRSYYKSKITGVLDRDTREAVRAYQTDNGLKDSGRIDMETYRKLELPYPATGKEADRLRGDGLAPKIGYGVKDTTVNSGNAVTGGVKKVGSSVRAGFEKTWDAGVATVSRSKEIMRGAGGCPVTARVLAGGAAECLERGDAAVDREVGRALAARPGRRRWLWRAGGTGEITKEVENRVCAGEDAVLCVDSRGPAHDLGHFVLDGADEIGVGRVPIGGEADRAVDRRRVAVEQPQGLRLGVRDREIGTARSGVFCGQMSISGRV